MRRAIAVLLALSLWGGLLPGTVLAGGEKGKPCADIVDGDGSYLTTDGVPTVTFFFDLAASSCDIKNKTTTYTIVFFAADEFGQPLPAADQPLLSQVWFGDGITQTFTFTHSFDPADAPAGLCTYAWTAIDGRIIDRAPDIDCFELPLDPTDAPSGKKFG